MSCETIDETVYVTVKRGDSLALSVDLAGAAGAADIDITGWSWLSELRDEGGVLAALLLVTPTDLTAGVVELTLTGVETLALAVADYGWGLQATDSYADTRTLVVGRLRVTP